MGKVKINTQKELYNFILNCLGSRITLKEFYFSVEIRNTDFNDWLKNLYSAEEIELPSIQNDFTIICI